MILKKYSAAMGGWGILRVRKSGEWVKEAQSEAQRLMSKVNRIIRFK